tara:strand:+ start:248 stop:496 length:249 start_codon:yes stop_codon:yes gene_type:complete
MPWNPEHYMKTEEVMKILEENKITNVGKDTPYSEEPFVSQWYWQTAKMHPYRKSKAFYHGPRIEWMNLMEESGQEKDTNKKD